MAREGSGKGETVAGETRRGASASRVRAHRVSGNGGGTVNPIRSKAE